MKQIAIDGIPKGATGWYKYNKPISYLNDIKPKDSKLTIMGFANDGLYHRIAPKLKLICKCECGVLKSILKQNVVSGKTKSCGCSTIKLRRRKYPGNIKEINGAYHTMIRRCSIQKVVSLMTILLLPRIWKMRQGNF